MKKLQVLVISLLFLITNNIQASFLKSVNPYSFGPQGRAVSELRDFSKPKYMARVLPNRPVAATDSSGNRVFYTSDGKLSLSISKNGAMSFSLGGVSKSYNSDGELTGITRTVRGSGLLQETKDSDGNILGYTTLNGKGQVSQTFDKDNNLTATYVYTKQGARKDYIINEMTGGRTYFDEYDRRMYETDFDGYILRTYLYSDVEYTVDENDDTRKTLKTTKVNNDTALMFVVKGSRVDLEKVSNNTALLTSVRDYTHNIRSTEKGFVDVDPVVYNETFYDLEGKEICTKNTAGVTVREYHYKADEDGNIIKDFHVDSLNKEKTYYDKYGKASETRNAQNVVIRKYFDGYSVNINKDGSYAEVTKYDIDGKELYTTLKNIKYNDDGTIDKIMDENDDVWKEYHYKEVNGKKVLYYVKTVSDAEFGGKETYTWYEDDKPVYVTKTDEKPTDDKDANIVKDFGWHGDTLVFTFDRTTKRTQWYNMNKELVYESLNERIISKNIYNNGQLVGKWDAQNHKVTIYTNERAWIEIKSDYEPTPEMVSALITHSAEIDNAIEKHEEGKVLDGLMRTFGWKVGSAQNLLVKGPEYLSEEVKQKAEEEINKKTNY